MVDIVDYETLLMAGREQTTPQQFLFVFLKAVLPNDHDESEAFTYQKGKGGVLQAVMCVDKPLDTLTTFSDLVKESENMQQEWHIVLVACLSGMGKMPPSAQEIELQLKMMVQRVENGGDLSRYLAFDREGKLVQLR